MKKCFKMILAILTVSALLTPMLSVTVSAELDLYDRQSLKIGEAGSHGLSGEWRRSSVANVTRSEEGAIGGKTADDTAFVFTVGDDANAEEDVYNYTGFNALCSDGTTTAYKKIVEFSVFVSGDAVATVRRNSSNLILNYGKGVLTTSSGAAGSLENGKWHRIVLAQNVPNSNCYGIFADNKYMGKSSWTNETASYDEIRFGLDANSVSGFVAFDDIVYYKSDKANSNDVLGYCYSGYVIKANNTSEDIFVDTDKNIIKFVSQKFSTVSELKSAILAVTDASEVRIYKDNTLTAEADEYTDGCTAVLVSSDGTGYHYYSFVVSDVDKVGLTLSYTTGESVMQKRLYIQDDSIVVLSHPHNASYWISSVMLYHEFYIGETLYQPFFSSSNGYTLRYVDKNKVEKNTEFTRDGYIKATKEGEEDVYIPIISKLDEESIDITRGYNPGSKSTAYGVCGKTADDISNGFTYTDSSSGNQRYQTFSASTTSQKNTTIVFNMYADSNADVLLVADGGFNFMKWSADGKISYISSTGDWYEAATAERGKWHRVAITYDKARNRKIFYVDGKYINGKDSNDAEATNSVEGLYFCAQSPPSPNTLTGSIYFDDVVQYTGYYDMTGDMTYSVCGTNVEVNTEANTIGYKNITSVNELKAAVADLTGASAVRIYTDSTLSAEASELDKANNAAVIVSANGLGYSYYTLEDFADKITDIAFSTEGGNIKASVTVNEAEEDMFLIIASYNTASSIKNINLTKISASEDLGAEKFATIPYNPECNTMAYLWSINLKPLKMLKYSAE